MEIVDMPGAGSEVSTRNAQAVARELLGDDEDRWRHTVGVAEFAAGLSVTVPTADDEVLVVAAWLHDIGYSPVLRDTGLHPLDGAAYLDGRGWPLRISGLVAHHSGARFLAQARGLETALDRYPDERSAVSDALTYADQRVGPYGQRMSIHARLADKITRHGPHSVQAQVRRERDPYLLAIGVRVEQRRRDAGETSRL